MSKESMTPEEMEARLRERSLEFERVASAIPTWKVRVGITTEGTILVTWDIWLNVDGEPYHILTVHGVG